MIAALELGLQWRAPHWFWLLLAIAALAVRAMRCRAHVPVCAPPVGPRVRSSWRARLVGLPFALEVLAVALGAVALARPVQLVAAPPERLVRDVVLCIDRSSSMAATDLQPGRSRLELALEMAAALVAARDGDRVGCIEFARYADLRCPPTSDHDALRTLLAEITLVAADGPEDATGIGGAVAAAAELLGRAPERGRVVVLLTDGEENVATRDRAQEIAPLHAAQWCAQSGIRVHTIVVGRGEQLADGRFVPLDPTAVQQLAAATGGRFFAAADGPTLRAVGAEIDALEAAAFAEPRRVVREWFATVLGAAVLALTVALALRGTWLRVVP